MNRAELSALGNGLSCGFTGTQQGMAPRQRKSIAQLLYHVGTIHLGDCIGADAEAHEEALRQGLITIGHPPSSPSKRAFLAYWEERKALPYLIRNRAIVAESVDGLIAAPKDFVEPASLRGQGTWTTVGYARQAGRRIWIVLPDGRIKEEAAGGR